VKSFSRNFAFLPLTAALALGFSSGDAHAQSITNVPISATASLDECRNLVSASNKVQIAICNQTQHTLNLSSVENALDSWKLGASIPPYTVQFIDFNPGGGGSFSNAASYSVGGTGDSVVFSVELRPNGKRKINVCSFGRPDTCMERMGASNDVSEILSRTKTRARAVAETLGKPQLIFQLK
jgi:hypothetical protein